MLLPEQPIQREAREHSQAREQHSIQVTGDRSQSDNSKRPYERWSEGTEPSFFINWTVTANIINESLYADHCAPFFPDPYS